MCAAAVAACSPAPPGRAPGADPGWADSPRGTERAAPRPREHWDLAAQLAPLRPATRRSRSEHLGGDLDGEVLASPSSGYPLRGPGSAAPAGATLVERLYGAERPDPVAYFVMVKHAPGYDPAGSDWEYLVVTPDAQVEDRGKLPLCARCHAEAPHDRLFGGGR